MEDHLGMFFLSFSSDVRGLYVAALVLGGAPLNPPVSPQLKERSALLHLGPRNACHSRMPLGFANRSRVKCFHQTRLSTYLPIYLPLPTYLPPSLCLPLSLSVSLSLSLPFFDLELGPEAVPNRFASTILFRHRLLTRPPNNCTLRFRHPPLQRRSLLVGPSKHRPTRPLRSDPVTNPLGM